MLRIFRLPNYDIIHWLTLARNCLYISKLLYAKKLSWISLDVLSFFHCCPLPFHLLHHQFSSLLNLMPKSWWLKIKQPGRSRRKASRKTKTAFQHEFSKSTQKKTSWKISLCVKYWILRLTLAIYSKSSKVLKVKSVLSSGSK